MKVLVTGATGYIGGRVVESLLERGHDVRVLVRDRERAQARPWAHQVEIFEGDVTHRETLLEPLRGVEAAYYLVHSMYGGEDFEARDREAAHNFVWAAHRVAEEEGASHEEGASQKEGVSREGEPSPTLRQVIYLGGILPGFRTDPAFASPSGSPSDGARDDALAEAGDSAVADRRGGLSTPPASTHLGSRAEVGAILRDGLPTTEFRAGPIIGSGSASFEMVRYLTERLPAMIAPKWILNEVQPVAMRNVLEYLVEALGRPETLGVIDVGTEPVTFQEMMKVYADVRGLPRTIWPVPVLAPRLAALWVGFVTPIPNALAVPLVEGVVQPVVGDTRRARELFPDVELLGYREAVERALARVREGNVSTRWTFAGGGDRTARLVDEEGIIREVRTRLVPVSQEAVFRAFSSLGGEKGWLVWGWAWKLRGLLDQLVGGPGLRVGRRHPTDVYPGEAIDFWRVEEVKKPSLLRLRAEMKVPGKAWLQFEAIPEDGGTRLVQTAFFAPVGFFGWLYWYGIYPLHAYIFSDMVEAIAREAEELAAEGASGAE